MTFIEQQINEKLIQLPKSEWRQSGENYHLFHKELGTIELTMDRSSGTSFIFIKKHFIRASKELINHVDEQIDLQTILQKL